MKITIDNSNPRKINPGMIGLFFEDINYAADGGLYAEMIENRNFSFFKSTGDWGDYICEPDYSYGWTSVDTTIGSFRIVLGSSHSKENPYYARIEALAPGFMIKNKAYEGLFLKKGMSYKVVFFARSRKYEDEYFVGATLNGQLVCKANVSSLDFVDESYNHWKKYEVSLVSDNDYDGCEFVFGLEKTGIAELDYISMMPGDAALGVFRKDLYELLRELHPGFIRFPGGCIVEGNTLDNKYDYKNTLRENWDRKTNWNRWAVHGTSASNHYETIYSHYNQTLGMGFYEYFLLCDSIGAKPLPVLNVGFSCQYQNDELVDRNSDEFAAFVQDALDLIEFANGSLDTKYGAIRAKMGHIRPFNLEFLGIGNEQWQTESHDFFERYLEFEKRIHEIYPGIKLIGSAGPDITSEKYSMAWDFYRKHQEEENFAFALDEHYYVKPEWLFEHNTFYDNYDRTIKVFSGEYAAHPCSGFNMPEANTLWGALSEAAFMTGVERNCDVVVLASYAPLFARVNYAQWSPDMIWFDAKTAYGSPSYFVQKLFANNMGDEELDIAELNQLREEGIYISVSKDTAEDKYIFKIVNSNSIDFSIDLTDAVKMKNSVTAIISSLTGDDKDAYNCISNPCRVSVKSMTVRMDEKVILKPYSFNVISF